MASENGVFVFPEAMKQAASNIDPNLLLAMQNNGGFGGNNWIWILFLWLIWGGNWGNNGFGGNNGTGYLANQMSNDAGRDLLLQAINGRADFLGSSVPKDDKHLALFIKDMIDDPDAPEGYIFNRFYSDTVFSNNPIDWDEML